MTVRARAARARHDTRPIFAQPTQRPAWKRDLERLLTPAQRRLLGKGRLYWTALGKVAQHAWTHPAAWAGGLIVLALVGLLGHLTALALVVAAGCALLGWERRGEEHRWLPTGRLYALAGFSCAALLFAGLTHPTATALASVAALAGIAHLRVPPDTRPKWWHETELLAMLDRIRVLPSAPPGHRYRLEHLRDLASDEHGEHRTFDLPRGVSWTALQPKRAEIASWLGVDGPLVAIGHPAGAGERTVTISRLIAQTAPVGGLSPLLAADTTDATQPVRLGVDERTGEPLHVDNDEANDLVAGVPGSGKTELVRMPVLAYAKDPRALLYVLDGKGSRKDYAPLVRRCERFVWGTDDDAPAQLVAMLREVLALVRDRNTRDTGAMDWPPVLLLCEELQDVRSGATPEQQAEVDELLGRIVRMGRAVRVKLTISTQRTSVDDVPSKVRNLLTQRIALRTLQRGDYALVLGLTGTPDVRLPAAKQGQGILRGPGALHALVPDRVPLAEWRAALDALPARTTSDVSVGLVVDTSPTLAPTPALLAAALDALAAGPLQASELWDRLPENVRPDTARALGVALAAHPEHVHRARAGKSYAWHRTTPAPTLALVKSDGRSAATHAGSSPSEGQTLAATEGAA